MMDDEMDEYDDVESPYGATPPLHRDAALQAGYLVQQIALLDQEIKTLQEVDMKAARELNQEVLEHLDSECWRATRNYDAAIDRIRDRATRLEMPGLFPRLKAKLFGRGMTLDPPYKEGTKSVRQTDRPRRPRRPPTRNRRAR